jgi:outer membrane receptor protein involved in Fe transport
MTHPLLRALPLVALVLALSAAPSAAPVQSAPFTGTVVDATGAAVAGATVIARSPSGAEARATTDTGGRFSIVSTATDRVDLIVRAAGFAEARRALAASDARTDLTFRLEPASIAEAITVTAARTEQRIGDAAASVSVLSREEIRQSPAVVADDVLRQLPSFSLFRRTSSLSSHPTAQGVSLRGIGPSGVSRTLVLMDGVPFNDPFGGWVYWTRVPMESADRIEVVDGATSSLYGNYAMGGVINIVTTPPERRLLEFRAQGGSFDTGGGSTGSRKVDLRASDVWGRLGVSVDFSAFDTGGYPIVAESERGIIDTKAKVNFKNTNVRLQYAVSDRVMAYGQVGYFRERRDNAKVSTFDGTAEKNDTEWTSVGAGIRAKLADGSDLQVRVFGDDETFNSNFLAVPPATPLRSIGRMTLKQTVPTTGFGTSAEWSRAFGARHAVSAGFDYRRVTGESQETGLDAQAGLTPNLRRLSGGRQQMTGLFVQDIISVTDALTVTFSGRIDRWKSDQGHNLENSLPSGTPTANNVASLPDREDTAGSPRVTALYQVTGKVGVWGSIGRGFRAPTLNELYRQFRVGTVLTLANNQLGPERLTGGELGLRFAPTRQVTGRITWYDNRVTDPVSNVTILTQGNNVTNQRQNLGATRIRGVQFDLDYRPTTDLRIEAGYLYNDARVTKNDTNISLVDKFLPQVPKHRGSVGITWSNPRWVTVGLDVQALGTQFDDDANSRVVPGYTEPGLPKYALVSMQVSRVLQRNVEVFFGAQNLLNQVSYVGTLPTTIGTPRLVTAGVRVRVRGR